MKGRTGQHRERWPVGPGQVKHHLLGVLFAWRSQFSATGPIQPACQVLHMSPRKPIFLLAAGPLLLIGILFLWPLCLRNGLKSPADWPKSFLPPGGRADAMCLFYGMYLSYWTLLDFPHPPHLSSGILGACLDMAGGPQQGHHCPECKPEGWVCGLSAALVRNAPTSQWEGTTDSGTPALQSCPVLHMLLHLPGSPVGQGTPFWKQAIGTPLTSPNKRRSEPQPSGQTPCRHPVSTWGWGERTLSGIKIQF